MLKPTFDGMSTPFAQAVAGRVVTISTTPLDTPNDERQFVITYKRVSTHNEGKEAPTLIVVPSGWLLKEQLDVVVSHGRVTMEQIPGAKLTEGVSYKSWTRVV